MSTKLSTLSVDNRPYWMQKRDLLRDGVIASDPLVRKFDPPRDPIPMTRTLRLPTMAERVAEFTRLGRPEGLYDDLEDDDFQDHLDDLPPEGLSRHEDPSYVRTFAEPPAKAPKRASDASLVSSATLPADGLAAASPTPVIEGVSPAGEAKKP